MFGPLRVPNTAEVIVRRIGEAISSGLLAPGERLPSEVELAAMLAVAPMTLRQALAILREAGLIDTRRGKNGGTFVAADVVEALGARSDVPNPAELRDLTDWRRAVSGEAAARAAARSTDADRARLASLAAEVERRLSGDFAAFRLADSRFHLAIAEAAASPRLLAAETAIQAELGEILSAIPAPVRAREASTGGHDPILAAVAAEDADAAGAAMRNHVEATFHWIVGLKVGRAKSG